MKEETILEVSSLSAGYGRDEAVRNLSFALRRGEILCLVGESGSGKSTVLKALIAAPEVEVLSGEIRYGEASILALPKGVRQKFCAEKMGMIFQSPGAAFNPIRTYEKQFVETLKSHGRYHADTFQKEVTETFAKVDLKEPERILRQCPYALSGGMNQRVALAITLLLGQEVLLCDEPTSALDATTALGVVRELKSLREKSQVSQIIVTHNLAMAGALADRIGVMCEGKLVEIGEAKEILNHPRQPYTKSLLEAVPSLKKQIAGVQDAGISKTCMRNSGDDLNEEIWMVEETREKKGETRENSEKEDDTEQYLLECNALSKKYHGNRSQVEALKEGKIRLKKGEILGVVGESGCGKTTLLKLISGLEAPDGGEILLNGRELKAKRAKADYAAVQMIFQDAVSSFHPRRKVADSIRETVQSLLGKGAEVDTKELAELVGLSPELMDRYPRQLSGGQCQRLAIARAVAVRPQVLLCDEVTSALDVSTQAQILKLLEKICRESGMAAVFVSHDIAVVSELCDRVIVMRDGGIVEEGDTLQVIAKPQEEYTKQLIDSVMEVG